MLPRRQTQVPAFLSDRRINAEEPPRSLIGYQLFEEADAGKNVRTGHHNKLNDHPWVRQAALLIDGGWHSGSEVLHPRIFTHAPSALIFQPLPVGVHGEECKVPSEK